MKVSEALTVLGAKRVIWIDDRFAATPAQLASQLTNGLEIAQACKIPELQDAFDAYDADAAAGLQMVTQVLTDLEPQRVEEIRAAFFVEERADKEFPTNELSADAISTACQLLGVAEADRWTFEKAEQALQDLCEAGDAELSYVVDLNESGGSPTRGLDMLKTLWAGQSKGTAFILTHETDIQGEAKKEQELREQLLDLGGLGLPVCVIAKERLSERAEDHESLAEALRVGVKRAGLRRSLHQVLHRARGALQLAIDNAAMNLLTVPPEQLEAYVFERGYKEGVSELHVVERAIAAQLGKDARAFFASDDEVQASLQRLRALRAISLQNPAAEPEPILAAFREAEVWETDELLNKALTPVACGDVFEVDVAEASTKGSKQKFILLGQPCDISLRPDDKKRAQDTAFLVPLKTKTQVKGEPNQKEPLLPFTLAGEQWSCDFRNASVARLSILDLASFRPDGRVRVDEGQTPPAGMLVAQQKVYDDRIGEATKALADPKLRPAGGQISLGLQLAFASSEAFKYVHTPVFEDATEKKVDGQSIKQPKRATWRLRRRGRVRMPYAAALLDLYTGVVSRQAFDLDFMSLGLNTVQPAASEPPAAAIDQSPASDDLKSTRRQAGLRRLLAG